MYFKFVQDSLTRAVNYISFTIFIKTANFYFYSFNKTILFKVYVCFAIIVRIDFLNSILTIMRVLYLLQS